MIVFDLEYYVPKEDRLTRGLSMAPGKDSHFIMGGTFRTVGHRGTEFEDAGFWIWDYDTEKAMLIAIWRFLKNYQPKNKFDKRFVGLGIIRSDLDVLKIKLNRYGIVDYPTFFEFLKNYVIYDLSQVLSLRLPHSQPKLVSHQNALKILKMPIIDKTKGTDVWAFYDKEDYQSIMKYNSNEVAEMYQMYLKVREELRDLYSKKESLP